MRHAHEEDDAIDHEKETLCAGQAETGWDPESGLYFFRNRYYDAHTGRFTAEDLVGAYEQSMYMYVLNAPLDLVDPYGTTECPCGSECPTGSWNFSKLVQENRTAGLIKSGDTFQVVAACYGINVTYQAIKADLSIQCTAYGAIAELGLGGYLPAGGFSNACTREELEGTYRGVSGSLEVIVGITYSHLWKQGGDESMNIGYGDLGLGVRIAYQKCKVSLGGGGGLGD